MKKNYCLFILLAFLCINIIKAQNVTTKSVSKIDTIYYDAQGKGVPNKAFAAYMRLIYKSDDPHYKNISRDYYITGELQGERDGFAYI